MFGSAGAREGLSVPPALVEQRLPASTAPLRLAIAAHARGATLGTLTADANGSWLAFTGQPLVTGLAIGDAPAAIGSRLLALLGEQGVAGLSQVDGSFALAWWDARSATLRLVRDRFGAEPLHFRAEGASLLFGSRAHDLAWAGGNAPRVSWQGLSEFLTYCYLPGTTTLYDGVLRVPAGSVVEWQAGRGSPAVRPWYRLSFATQVPADEGAITRQYRELLEQAVVRRLGGGRPGVLLSGGMDSSSAATFATRHLDQKMSSFSFRCSGNSFDESSFARALANELGTTHHEVDYGELESLTIVDAVRQMDTPFCDIGIEIGTWLLTRAAGNEVDYLLTGDGGDEIWASHPVYAAQRVMKWYDRLHIPTALQRGLASTLDLARDSDSKRGMAVVLKRILPPPGVPRELGHFRWRMYYTPDNIGRMLMPSAASHVAGTNPFAPVLDSFAGYDGPDDGMSLWLYSDYTTASGFYFSRLMLARAFGLQARMPFYDRDLVEYGAKIPAHLKLEGLEKTKRLFRVAMEGVLPDIINHRKDKLGHSVPLKNWLRGNGNLVSLLRQTLESESFRSRGLFRPEAVEKLLSEHEARRHNHSHRLWALFVLELWMRENIDRRKAADPSLAPMAARA